MEKFGLIGRTLKHSYSKKIHALLGDYPYDLYEIEPHELKSFVSCGNLSGFNVTIPYKKDIMPYLDVIDGDALKIGAVNTVVKRDGKLFGYNTDFLGMKYMLSRAGISLFDKKVMILGTGGTSNTAVAVAKSEKAKEIVIVSRFGSVNYQNCYEHIDTEVIINTTPVGMYPNNYACPIDITKFKNLLGVADAIYNPDTTEFCFKAKGLNIAYTNGLPMLVAQAKYATEKFLNKEISDDAIEKILDKLWGETLNVVLIGMPGSGKTTIGTALGILLDREFIDTDALIEKKDGRDIPTIFRDSGEEYFRKLESEVINEVGKLTGKVISTGGGAVKNRDNCFALKSNGIVFMIERDLEKLSRLGRPLSKDSQSVKNLYCERIDNYHYFADYIIENNGDIDSAVKGVVDLL